MNKKYFNNINGFYVEDSESRQSINELNVRMFTQESENISQTNEIATINNKILSLASGAPAGVYATLVELQTANPATGTYLITADGHLYSWVQNGTATDLGVYQASVIGDKGVHFHNLNDLLRQGYSFKFENINSQLTWTENKFYNYTNGQLTDLTITNGTNCTQLDVIPGEIYHLKGRSVNSGRLYNLVREDGTVHSYAEQTDETGGDNIDPDVIVVIPEGVNKLQINTWVVWNTAIVEKCISLKLGETPVSQIEDIIDNQVKTHKALFNSALSRENFDRYIGASYFRIPTTDFNIEEGDLLEIEGYTKGENIVGCLTNDRGQNYNVPNIVYSESQNGYFRHLRYAKGITGYDYYQLLLTPYSKLINSSGYLYKVTVKNLTKGTILTNVLDYFYPDNADTSVSMVDININVNEIAFINNVRNKTIICAGDSLTDLNPNTNSTYVNTFKTYYPECEVLNLGSSGAHTDRLVNKLTNMVRDTLTKDDGSYTFPAVNPDYSNCSAVIINIGTNGGVTGDINTSIPQLANATDNNGNTLKNISIEKVLNEGIVYGGESITTENAYWTLFNNDFYGNLALCIEYIQNKNPETQIFLHAPLIAYNILPNATNGAKTIESAMLQLCDLYGVNYIDTIRGLNINQRNSEQFSYDGVHGTAERDVILGHYLAKQVFNKIH